MAKVLAILYGVICHVMFLLIFVYLTAFLGNFDLVPKTIDSGTPGPLGMAIVINVLLLGAFAVPHSVMARPGFKQWWTQFVPKQVERSTYVLVSNLLFILLFWQWQPMTGVVWEVEHQTGATVLWGLFFFGFVLVVIASFVIDHFDLFGLRQVYLYARGVSYNPPVFRVAWFYKFVRHPLLLGWMIAFWSTPRMSTGHLLFAVATTAYMLIAIRYEERDLVKYHGDAYRDYRRRVSMIISGPSKN